MGATILLLRLLYAVVFSLHWLKLQFSNGLANALHEPSLIVAVFVLLLI
jgi:hypothetical protein